MREIVLDTETTGLNPAEGHRLVEIGCLEIVNQIATGAVYHVLINPERDVPDDAYRIHGHSTAFLADKPVFAQIAPDFLAFIGEDRLVIHNAEFDMRFINAELAQDRPRAHPAARASSTRSRWRGASIPAPPPASTRSAIAIASTGRAGSSTARCSTPKSWSRSTANCSAGASARWLFLARRARRAGREGAPIAERKARPAPLAALLTEAEARAHAEHIATLGESALWRRYG